MTFDLTGIYRAFDIDEPIEADDNERYVDLAPVRGEIEVAGDLVQCIVNAGDKPSHLLLMGHTKCGKTTELNRTNRRLRDTQYATVFFDVAQDADTLAFEYTTVLLLMAAQIEHQLRNYTIDIGNRSKKLADFLVEKEVSRGIQGSQEGTVKGEAEIGSGFLSGLLGKLGFGVELRGGFQRSREITVRIEQDTRGFMELIQELIADADEKVKRAGYTGLAVICDGCDKLALHATDEYGRPYDLQRAMFVDHQADLRDIPCHVIYTVPISIQANLGDIWGEAPVPITAIPVNPLPDSDDKYPLAGRTALKQVVERRLQQQRSSIAALFTEEDLLEQLIDLSGGHISDLLLLIQLAVRDAQVRNQRSLSTNEISRAIRRRKVEFTRLIEQRYVGVLREIDSYKKPPANSDEYREIIFKRLALEYFYGDELRVDLHPLVAASEAYRRQIS
jgi:hypothetical protein